MATGSFNINYGEVYALASQAEAVSKSIKNLSDQLPSHSETEAAGYIQRGKLAGDLWDFYTANANYHDSYVARLEEARSKAKGLATRLKNMHELTVACEKKVLANLETVVEGAGFSTAEHAFAPSYAVTLAVEKAEADKAEDERIKQEAAAEDKRKQDEEDAKKRQEEHDREFAKLFPLAWAAYQDRLTEAQMLAMLEEYKDDPELYAIMLSEYEAWKKAKEAAKDAASGDLGLGISDGDSDEGSGLGDSDWGGSGGGFDLGSDGGGAGFGSDFGSDLGGSDWGSSDWASDLLDENLDTDDFVAADEALDDIATSELGSALDTSLSAVAEDAAQETSGFWAAYGPQAAELVRRYGMQTGLMLGSAAALYLTREQTTEAVAHVAEFVTTKCRPAVDDVMDQVRDAAKRTRVNVNNATTSVRAAARGERAGDLIG